VNLLLLVLGGLDLGLGAFLLWQQRRYQALQGWIVKALEHRDIPLPTVAPRILRQYHEQALQSLQRLQDLEHLLAQLPLGYLSLDAMNRVQTWNPLALELLSLPVSQMHRPRRLLELVRSIELDQLVEQTRQTGRSTECQWVLNAVHPDPDQPVVVPGRSLLTRAIALEDGRVVLFLQDRQEIADLIQHQSRWISDVAHELKTPLTSIRLLSEALQSQAPTDLQDTTEGLHREVLRLSYLVQDLLELSRLEQRLPQLLHREPVDLPALIRAAWQSLDPLVASRGLGLYYQGPEAFWLSGDASRLYRVFLNLLDNASRFSPPDGCIQIHVCPQATRLCVDVIDSGPGFPEADLSRVFERFYRAESSRARPACPLQASSGSGLGLAIVHQIIEAHGGHIEARNHPTTGGAWVQLCLPNEPPLPQTSP
jgi:two-component system, OmpR family, phosphate regulon sensor histidine kinase PhoR